MAKKLYRVADQIAATRKARNLTVSGLAERAGVSRPAVRSVEKGRASVKSKLRVLHALETSLWTNDRLVENLGHVLASHRNQQRVSQRHLAKRLIVTQPKVISLEARTSGRMDTLQKYLDVTQVRNEVCSKRADGKRRLIPAKDNAQADKVYTPRQLAAEILSQFSLFGRILDPSKGDGAFFDQFPAHVDACWCELECGVDFFAWEQKVDWVITNPPWSKFRAFLEHAMRVSDNVAFLAPLTHFSTKARVRDIRKAGFAMRKIIYVPTPVEWPASGFQLAAVWLQRGWSGACEVQHIGSSD
ncbi:transcriptional regulator [Shimia sp. R9_1]|uniref:helix-turn-helix transcriptional regulator n=1 Tax=Shimia sp. R9_1 TaxID=2821111 RepID=UPI001AD9CDF4|nr:helix-turn-helix transcriptional regulator [Shimia sp. R9_1]MBO9406183.1 transcriptional regulator [Shimia sp. R9_1]